MQPPPPRGMARAESASEDSFAPAATRIDAHRPRRKPRLQKIAAHLQNDRIALAEKELSEHLARRPDDADAISLLAQTVVRLGRRTEAASLLARCLELAPNFDAARFDYAKLLVRLSRFSDALGEVDFLLKGHSDNPLLRELKAHILGFMGETRQSLAVWQQLTAAYPGRAECWLGYGHALRASSRREDSMAAYREALECRRSFGAAWWGLADMKTVRFSDADVAAMEQQLTRPDIAPDDRINLQFSLGKAYEDLCAYDRSFEHYAKANAAMRLRIDHNWDAIASRVADNKSLFTPEFFRSRGDAGCSDPSPIFILGRPRSGSTLIEQILSSHAAIEGTAELPYIHALAERLEERECRATATDYPRVLKTLEPSVLATFGESYLQSAAVHRKLGRALFIDKSPTNYFHIGMIFLILPNAKIVDARRHPAATCLSMFKQNQGETNLRLSELGRVYRDYVALLAHFDSAMPGRIHRVIYEDMVANPEAEIRRLLDHLGLPFEESCLRFHETERTVFTPSSEQVRKPISADAVDHWRNFESSLAPLIKSLGSALTAYPSVPEDLH